MKRLVPIVILLVSACGSRDSEASGSSVTVKLPPPKPAVAPGFSSQAAPEQR
jgi:hypothetical protein